MPTVPRRRSHEAPLIRATAKVGLDGLSGKFGHRCGTPFGFVPEAGVEVFRKFDGGPLHGMSAYLKLELGRRCQSSGASWRSQFLGAVTGVVGKAR